ncbi:MAG: hypothetical protein RLZZ373_3539 [Pseudomonadota bacterium]
MALDLYNPWIAVAALALALGTTGLLAKCQSLPTNLGRYASIDGLRGFLAFFVFLHHGSIWFVQLHQQAWTTPKSNLYRHFGDSSVALFFMITAFLFTGKILDSQHRPIDWVWLYVGRVMRLFPLYAVAVTILWLMAWSLTDWTLQVSPCQLWTEVLNWLVFTVPRGESVNGLLHASRLVANVTWSLPYEWWFYLCLPAMAVLLRKQTSPLGWLLFSFSNALLFKVAWHLDFRLIPFLGGVLAAYAVRHEALCRFSRQQWTGLIVLLCLGLAVKWTPTAYTPPALVLLSTAFILMACGNDLFGILSAAPSRILGDIAYSLYLLHGLLLSFVFHWLVGWSEMARWSEAEHWTLVVGLSVPLILLSYAASRWIEKPIQQATPAAVAWIRRKATPPP